MIPIALFSHTVRRVLLKCYKRQMVSVKNQILAEIRHTCQILRLCHVQDLFAECMTVKHPLKISMFRDIVCLQKATLQVISCHLQRIP